MSQKPSAEGSAIPTARGALEEAAGSGFLPPPPKPGEKLCQDIGTLLVQRLLLDGAEKGLTIQDIDALVSGFKTIDGRSPKFMRDIIIDLALCLRQKYAVK